MNRRQRATGGRGRPTNALVRDCFVTLAFVPGYGTPLDPGHAGSAIRKPADAGEQYPGHTAPGFRP